jgi:hypothetical protein
MSHGLPAEVSLTELPDGVRYRLPGRKWGHVACLGLGALVVGLLGVSFMSFWLWAVGFHLPANGPQAADGMLLIFLALGAGCF